MFTLNELYSVSRRATTKLLLSMTAILEPGLFLLMLDSPESYLISNIGSKDCLSDKKDPPLSKQKEVVPMQWLLDDTLIDRARMKSVKNPNKWEILYSNASMQYKCPPGLIYPISLENIEYQVHLYRQL